MRSSFSSFGFLMVVALPFVAVAEERSPVPPGTLPRPPARTDRDELGRYLVLDCRTERAPGSQVSHQVEVYELPEGRRATVISYDMSQDPLGARESNRVAIARRAMHGNEETESGTGLTIRRTVRPPLSPQRFSASVDIAVGTRPLTGGAMTCQEYERLRPGQLVDVEANCYERNGTLGSAHSFLLFSGNGPTTVTSDPEVVPGNRVAELRTTSSFGIPDRSVRLTRREPRGRNVRQYRGAGFALDIALDRRAEGDRYEGAATVNVRRMTFGQPTTYENRTMPMLCSVFDHLPAGTRALDGLFDGRGPAVDREGMRRMEAELARLQTAGLITLVSRSHAHHGGFGFCVELATGQPEASLRQAFEALRRVDYNRGSTSLNLWPRERCGR